MSEVTQVSEQGVAFIKAFEGRALRAYRDAVGVWTIGYGNTNADKNAVAIVGKIGAGLTITDAQADSLLRSSLARGYFPAVDKRFPDGDQFVVDGGSSFHYNTGNIVKAKWPTYWNAGNKAGARTSLLSWNKGGGRVLAGLTRRRNAEWRIIADHNYGPEGRIKPAIPQAQDIGPSDAPDETPGMLRRGSTGEDVTLLQQALVLLGYKVSETAAYDDKTEAAVRAFQKTHPQLNSDGIAGPATRAAITREADLKRRLKQTTVSGAGGTTGTALLDILPHWVPYAVGAAAVLAIGYFAWQYRDEIRAWVNRKLGKTTP